MFAKLLKYDLKRLYKILVVFYALGLVFAGLARIVDVFDNGATIWFIIEQIIAGAMWSMAVSGVINGVIRPLRLFRVSAYGDESYLIHTLPMKRSTIFLEKFVTGAIVIFSSIAIMIAQLAITYLPFDELTSMLELLNSTLGTSKWVAAIFLFLIFYLEILMVYAVGIAGIVFGRRKNNRKVLWSVIFGFSFYIFSLLLVVGLVAGYGIIDKEMLDLFSNAQGNMISGNIIKEAVVICIIGYSLAIGILQTAAGKSFSRGVNVE